MHAIFLATMLATAPLQGESSSIGHSDGALLTTSNWQEIHSLGVPDQDVVLSAADKIALMQSQFAERQRQQAELIVAYEEDKRASLLAIKALEHKLIQEKVENIAEKASSAALSKTLSQLQRVYETERVAQQVAQERELALQHEIAQEMSLRAKQAAKKEALSDANWHFLDLADAKDQAAKYALAQLAQAHARQLAANLQLGHEIAHEIGARAHMATEKAVFSDMQVRFLDFADAKNQELSIVHRQSASAKISLDRQIDALKSEIESLKNELYALHQAKEQELEILKLDHRARMQELSWEFSQELENVWRNQSE